MKTCGVCGKEKPLDDFAWKNQSKGWKQWACRPCHKEYRKTHYEANRKKYIDRVVSRRKILREENHQKVLDYLLHHPCVDCGESDPIVLEFDHVRGDKLGCVGNMITEQWTKILEEIQKCEVRCCNCHQRMTSKRLGSFRYLASMV